MFSKQFTSTEASSKIFVEIVEEILESNPDLQQISRLKLNLATDPWQKSTESVDKSQRKCSLPPCCICTSFHLAVAVPPNVIPASRWTDELDRNCDGIGQGDVEIKVS